MEQPVAVVVIDFDVGESLEGFDWQRTVKHRTIMEIDVKREREKIKGWSFQTKLKSNETWFKIENQIESNGIELKKHQE